MKDEQLLEYVSSYRDSRRPGGKRFLLWASLVIHVAVVAGLLAIPLLTVDRDLPHFESISTFLAPPVTPPPPPPPAPAAKRAKPVHDSAPPRLVREASFVAPVVIPDSIPAPSFGGDDGVGVPGGVEGGVPGGIVGGLPDAPLPSAPPEPVRLDFRRAEARPLVRIDPTYPELAEQAHVQGVVILEVLVDTDGQPSDIKVMRSVPMLEAAAIEAVREWRWSPYRMLDRPVPFLVTVTVSFRLT